MATTTIGAELRKLLIEMTELIIETRSKKKREELLRQQAQVAGELQVLVDKVVDDALPEYQEATKAIAAASNAAKAAKADLDKTAATIDKIADPAVSLRARSRCAPRRTRSLPDR